MKSGRFGWWEFAAVGSIGALFGLFTGLSASPVVGGALTGLFGILTAAATFILRKTKEFADKAEPVDTKVAQPPTAAAQAPADAEGNPGFTRIASQAIVLFCASHVFFMFLGIELRTGAFAGSFMSKAQENPVSVSDLVGEDAKVGSDFYLRLLLLQKMLQDGGVPLKEANTYLKYVAKSGGDKWVLSAERVKEHESFLREHWEFMSRVRKQGAESAVLRLEEKLNKNNVPDAVWKEELGQLRLSLDRQPRDIDSEREQAAVAKALFGLRNLMAPEMDVVASQFRKALDLSTAQKSKQDNRPALAH